MPRFISIGCVVLVLFGATAPYLAGQGTSPKKMSAEKANLPPPSLAELGKLYQALELPLPPKEAFFAMYGCFDHPLVSSPRLSYQLRMATGDPKSGYRIWQGFKDAPTQSLEIAFSRPPKPETVLRYMKMDRLPGSSSMREAGPYAELGFAVQCHLLQHHELAKFFYGRVQKDTDVPPNQTLVMLAWNYWAGELTNPERDLAEVARRLHNLADHHGFSEILASWTGNTQKHKDLLDRIDLTAKRSFAKAGSVESLIDDLQTHLGQKPNDDIDEDETMPAIRRKNPKQNEPSPRPDPESKLRNMGFAAIPLLIEHVDDRRLVRRYHDTFAVNYGAGEVTRIEALNSDDFPSVGKRVRGILSAFFNLDPHKATKMEYLNAWNELRSMTEADFVSKQLNHIKALNR